MVLHPPFLWRGAAMEHGPFLYGISAFLETEAFPASSLSEFEFTDGHL